MGDRAVGHPRAPRRGRHRLRHPPHHPEQRPASAAAAHLRPPRPHRRLRPLFAGVAAFEVANCAATLLILRATELLRPGHGQDKATAIALGLYVAYNLAATLTSLAAGRRADTNGATPVLIVGVAAFALAYIAFTQDTANWAVLVPPFLLAGVGIGCVETAEHAAVAANAPEGLRGSAFGLLAGVQSLGNLAASFVAGLLWTAFSPTWAFAYLAAWMLLALAGLIRTQRRRPLTGSP